MRRLAKLGLAGLACLAAPLAAAQTPEATPSQVTPPAVRAAIECRKLTEDRARLACYDKAMAGLDQALSTGEVVAVDQQQVRAARRQSFGFVLPSLSFLERGAKPEEINEEKLPIRAVSRTGDGKWIIELEGGQVWRQIDTNEFTRDPKPGREATVKRAMLGSYIMMIGGHSPVRVHRDQ